MFRAIALCAALAVPGAVMAAPMTAATYVKKAGAGDLFEIQSSKLVMTSTNPGIKQFAQRMVTDHTQSTAEVKAAAMQVHVKTAPPMLDPAQKAMMAKLRAAHGTARDTLYVSQQKTAHDQALALHQGYSADGSAAPLKAVAMKIVPVVQSHIQMLSSM